jgi:drug/metabolite transporter (DMT)-like permease
LKKGREDGAPLSAAQTRLGIALALASALLFGFVNVVAKGTDLHPVLLSGLAYLIAGALAAPTLRSWRPAARDLPTLLLMAIVGGVLAPAALFTGLRHAAAVDASLLLTSEMVFTSSMAAVVLRERLRPQAFLGVLLLLGASVAVALGTAGSGQSTLLGAFLVLGAALGWAVDNILGTRLMGRYRPVHMLAVKGLGGGTLAILAFAATGGSAHVPAEAWWRVIFVGGLGIGASAFCFYVALRTIGATRTSALCLPTSALAGALGGALVLHESLGAIHLAAALLLAAGVALVAWRPVPGPAAAPGPA